MNAPVTIADPFAQARFELELELIGGLINAQSGTAAHYRAAAAIVGPEHFRDSFNAKTFDLIGEAVESGVDQMWTLAVFLRERLRMHPQLIEAKLDFQTLFRAWLSRACPAISIEACAQALKVEYLRDEAALATEEHRYAEVSDITAEMDRLSVFPQAAGAEQPVGAVALEIANRMQDAYQNGKPAKDYAYAGSGTLASMIGGWRRGRFYVLGGRPAMGKTTTGLSLLLNTAKAGHGVMLFSLEMGKDELTEMALCKLAYNSTTRVEYRDLNPSRSDIPEYPRMLDLIYTVQPVLAALPIEINDKAGLTLAQIRDAAIRYAKDLVNKGKRLEVIAIDHLNLIKASDRYRGNKVAETEETSGALKVLAKELDCAVVCLVQLNRANEAREEKRPTLSDLRWSGAIEQDADVVMFVYREAYYLEHGKFDDVDADRERINKLSDVRNKLEIQIAKQRGGPTGTLEMFCDLGCAYVGDMDRRHG